MSWTITPLYFFSLNLIYFGQKLPIEVKFSDFWVVGWKFTKFLKSYLKSQVSFSLNLHHSSMSWEKSLLYLAETLIWFLQKEPTKVQNFRLSTTQVKFHKICTLIGYFCWKYIKFQQKKYGGNMSHDTKSAAKFEEKLTCGLENDMRNLANFNQNTWNCQNWHFHGTLLSKVQNTWATNLQRSHK